MGLKIRNLMTNNDTKSNKARVEGEGIELRGSARKTRKPQQCRCLRSCRHCLQLNSVDGGGSGYK